MNLLIEHIISCCKVTPITIFQKVVDRDEGIAKKYGIKYPMKFKDHKEVTICEDDNENYQNNG